MIVTCESCSTSFQLDESRIPATGANVRCSKCKHAFFLPSPTATPEDAVHSVAEEAAQTASAAPEASRETDAAAWDGLAGDSPSIGGGAVEAPAPTPEVPVAEAPEPELDEEEWHFSEEIRTEADEPDVGSDGLLRDDLDAELSADVGEGFGDGVDASSAQVAQSSFDNGHLEAGGFDGMSDPAGGFDVDALSGETDVSPVEMAAQDAPEIARVSAADAEQGSGLDLGSAEPEPVGEVPGHDDSSFGTVDDFSSLMEDDADGTEAASALAAELGSTSGEAASSSGISTYSSGGQTDDLGDPESWDLVGGDAPMAAPPTRAPRGAQDLAAELDAASADDFFGDVDDDVYGTADLAAATRSFAAGPIGRAARAVGWLAAGAALAFVAQLIGVAEIERWSQGPISVSAGPISARTLESGWLRTTRTGPVLRVAGEVENTAGQPMTPGAVQLVLLDRAGERLLAPAVGAGVPLDERVLREAEAGVLLEQAAYAVRRFAGTEIGPGERRPFEIVIPETRLPEDAERFLLEVGEPAPASRRGPSPVAPARAVPGAPTALDAGGASSAASGGGGAQEPAPSLP